MLTDLYDEVGPTAYSLAARVAGSPDLAEDIVAEVFETVAPEAERGRPPTALALLMMVRSRSIARRHADRVMDGYDRTRDLESTEIPGPTSASSYAARTPSPELIRRQLQALPVATRRALELVFFDGLAQVDLAVRLGVPLDQARREVHSGLAALRAAGTERE